MEFGHTLWIYIIFLFQTFKIQVMHTYSDSLTLCQHSEYLALFSSQNFGFFCYCNTFVFI